MLDETKLDESLEVILKMAEDDILKAKTPEERQKAWDNYESIQKIGTERIKVQNERYISEGKLRLEVEKMENEKELNERKFEAERKDRLADNIINGVALGFKMSGFGAGLFTQWSMMRANHIAMDPVEKGMEKSITGQFGNWLSGK